MAAMTPRDRADVAYSQVLQKLPHGAATKLAKEMGISDKDFSEIKNESLAPSLYLLAHLGYKIVPVGSQCMSQVSYDFLMELHQRVTRRAPKLCWEDSEHGAMTEPGALGGAER